MEDGRKGGDVGAQDGCHAVHPEALGGHGASKGIDLPAERPVRGLRTAGAVDDGDPVQVLLCQSAEEVVVNAEIGNIDVGVRA